MVKQIVCIFNLFDNKHRLYFIDENGKEIFLEDTTFDRIGDAIMSQCIINDTDKVHLIGSEKFSENICKRIREYENMTYGTNKIEIEVN